MRYIVENHLDIMSQKRTMKFVTNALHINQSRAQTKLDRSHRYTFVKRKPMEEE